MRSRFLKAKLYILFICIYINMLYIAQIFTIQVLDNFDIYQVIS